MDDNSQIKEDSSVDKTFVEKVPENFEQKPIRTYESDLAEAMKSKHTSQISIVLAETARSEKQQETLEKSEDKIPSNTSKNLFKILLSLVLITAGIVGGFYLYKISPIGKISLAVPSPTAQTIPSIIPVNIQKTFDITNLNTASIVTQISNEEKATQLQPNQIEEIIFGEKTTTNTGAPQTTFNRVTASQFIAAMGFHMSDSLTRSFNDNWMFGFMADTQPEPFIIFTTNFFQSSFAGMLSWEGKMTNDLAPLFNIGLPSLTIAPPPVQATSSPKIATSTKNVGRSGSSTPASAATINAFPNSTNTSTSFQNNPSASFFNIQGHFVDAVVKNKDVREFITDTNNSDNLGSGNILFLYSFIDNNTLVIAKDETTLATIIDLIEKQSYIR